MSSSFPDNNGDAAAPHRAQQPGSLDHGEPSMDANPYGARYGAAASHPDLDANAPILRSSDMRRMNRRALVFLIVLVALLALAVTWMFTHLWHNDNSRKPREEVVSVPAAPKLPPLPSQPQVPAIPVAPIPVASAPVLPQLPPPRPEAAKPRGPTLVERRIMDTNTAAATGVNGSTNAALAALQQYQQQEQMMLANQGGPPDTSAAPVPTDAGIPPEFAMPANSAYKGPGLDKTASAKPLGHPDTVMTRGTYIRCVLETHIVTDVPGFTSCIVTEPVYSFTGKRLLLPKGSKVLGSYSQEPNGERVAVVWDRILTPNGIDVNMASPGIDQLGGAGHPGYLDHHWGQRIGAALLISMLSDAFSYAAAKNGPETTTVTNGMAVQSPWQSNTAHTLQSLANQAVRRSANRPDTLTIHQGVVVYVYVAKDVDFTGVVGRY
jgi:type IV secretion system protein VirB10